MQAADHDFNISRLERYLTMINEAGIKPVMLLSKIDLVSPDDLSCYINKCFRHIILFKNQF